MQIDVEALKAIGLTEEELQNRVIDSLCTRLLTSVSVDDEDRPHSYSSRFQDKLSKEIKTQIDARIQALAEQHLLPKISDYIENVVLQETNQWGEKKGEPMSFIEYLVSRAEAYLLEPVDFEGKKLAKGMYGRKEEQTRISHLIDQHLHYRIETAMKEALQTANDAIAKGIAETAKIKMTEIAKTLQVSVKVRG